MRRLRESAGLSQERLAASLGLSVERMQDFEAGSCRIRAGELWEIARFFEVEPVYFFGGIGTLEPERSRLPIRRAPTGSRKASPPIRMSVANDNGGLDG
nr:helix-turn-helix transcriptional regulator [Aurantimonas sp. VKM B-3413]